MKVAIISMPERAYREQVRRFMHVIPAHLHIVTGAESKSERETISGAYLRGMTVSFYHNHTRTKTKAHNRYGATERIARIVAEADAVIFFGCVRSAYWLWVNKANPERKPLEVYTGNDKAMLTWLKQCELLTEAAS